MKANSKFTDRDYLKDEQYRDGRNLRARITLHEKYSTNPLGLHPWVFDRIDLAPAAAILEVGCGPGDLWRNNRDRLPPGWRIILSDLSPGMVAEARLNLDDLGNFAYVSFDVTHAPLLPSSFDAVIANHMLYHVPDVGHALAAIHDLLKPGGVLYATTNGRSHLREIATFVSQAKADSALEPNNILRRTLENFNLQSGRDQLQPLFADVELRPYPDSLEVDDPEAIVHFVQSSLVFALSSPTVTRLRDLLHQQLESKGVIAITKESGLFIARKAIRA